MTTPLNMTPQNIPTSDQGALRSQWSRLWLMVKISFVVLATGTVLLLLWSPWQKPPAAVLKPEPLQNATVVQLVGPRLIAVQAGSLLEKKLAIVPASREQIATPVLTVTGSVVARLRAGGEPAEDRWQFSSPELLTTYADWQKARTEVDFAEKQLRKTREL